MRLAKAGVKSSAWFLLPILFFTVEPLAISTWKTFTENADWLERTLALAPFVLGCAAPVLLLLIVYYERRARTGTNQALFLYFRYHAIPNPVFQRRRRLESRIAVQFNSRVVTTADAAAIATSPMTAIAPNTKVRSPVTGLVIPTSCPPGADLRHSPSSISPPAQ
jgi:hypothetical protein